MLKLPLSKTLSNKYSKELCIMHTVITLIQNLFLLITVAPVISPIYYSYSRVILHNRERGGVNTLLSLLV